MSENKQYRIQGEAAGIIFIKSRMHRLMQRLGPPPFSKKKGKAAGAALFLD
jgi:hypothetical protein